jgi:hypothetical protein
MKMIASAEIDWAKLVFNEVVASQDSWWRPVTDKHQIFEQAYMKFVNRNLNYYNFKNMLLSLIEGYEFNKTLPKTLEFCEYVRTLTNDRGPFGRMCVWNIPPRAELLLHKDAFQYHHMIVRNIFILSQHNNNNSEIKIQETSVNYSQGTLFQFSPAIEAHSFKNNSDHSWYFLGFDYWIPEKLFDSLTNTELGEIFNDSTRQQSGKMFGIGNCKFMSNH